MKRLGYLRRRNSWRGLFGSGSQGLSGPNAGMMSRGCSLSARLGFNGTFRARERLVLKKKKKSKTFVSPSEIVYKTVASFC